MKLLLSSECFRELLLGPAISRRKVSAAIESLTKKNHIFVLALPVLEAVLAEEPDSVKREIIWNQSKNLFLELLPIRKEELVLALRLSQSEVLDWSEWVQVALASLADLDGILCDDKKWKNQTLVKVLFTEEIDLDGIA